MRNIATFIITAILTIGAFSVSAQEITVDKIEYGEKDVICSSGNAAIIKEYEYCSAMPLVAIKDANGRLTNVSKGVCRIKNGKCQIGFDIPENLYDSLLEIYYFDGMKNIKPLYPSERYLINNVAERTYSNYSDVYLSSRWFRNEGRDSQAGTLNILKQFMATGEKWGYISDAGEINKIKDLGITFQNAVNINIGNDSTRAILFDGSFATAPWMSWGTNWSCVNNPQYVAAINSQIRTSINNGVREIQFDDWASNVAALSWGACFCDYCMFGFRDYINENYTLEQISQLGIDNIDTFNYKGFLHNKYGILSNDEYIKIMTSEPLNTVYKIFQRKSVRSFHSKALQTARSYSSSEMHFDHNVTNFGTSYSQSDRIFCYDIYDGGIGETKTAAMELSSVLTTGSLSKAIDKPYIYSPIPDGNNMPLIRQTIALCYATGQHILVPWDIWLHDNERYFTTLEETGDLFHFVRQYPQLFDNMENEAEVGIIVNMDEVSVSELATCVKRLFSESVPFKLLVSKQDTPSFSFTSQDMLGIKYLICLSGSDNISEDEKSIIASSGAEELTLGNLPKDLTLAQCSATNVFTAVRTDGNNKSVHVLNRSGSTVSDINVYLSEKLITPNKTQAVIYAPGENPQRVAITIINGKYTVQIGKTDEWCIIALIDSDAYAFDDLWSGIQTGTTVVPSDFAVMQDGIATVKTHGFGLGGTVSDIEGTQDRIGFVYRKIKMGSCRSFELGARVNSSEGNAGITVREYPNSNCKYVALEKTDGGVNISYRSETNTSAVTTFYPCGANEYLKLLFNAEDRCYEFYISSDKIVWEKITDVFGVDLVQKLVGVYGTSVSGKAETSVFSDVYFEYAGYAEAARPTQVNINEIPDIEEGGKYILKSTVITKVGELSVDEYDASYISENENIFIVSKYGVITGVSAGEADVTVTVSAGEHSVSKKVGVRVYPKNYFLASDDFESGVISDKWVYTDNSANGGYIRIEDEERGKVLSIFDNVTSNNINAVGQFRITTEESVIAEFDFKTGTEGTSKSKGSIVFYTYDANGTFATSLLTSAKQFYIMENNINTPICSMTENAWYHIKLEMLLPQCRQIITISDSSGIKYSGEHCFRNTVFNLAKFSVGGNVSAVGTYSYWDNINVNIKR